MPSVTLQPPSVTLQVPGCVYHTQRPVGTARRSGLPVRFGLPAPLSPADGVRSAPATHMTHAHTPKHRGADTRATHAHYTKRPCLTLSGLTASKGATETRRWRQQSGRGCTGSSSSRRGPPFFSTPPRSR